MLEIIELEKQICKNLKIQYYPIQENQLDGIIDKEIHNAGLSLTQIRQFINVNQDALNSYVSEYVKLGKMELIGGGYLISHSIFIMKYLISKEELMNYLYKSNTKKQANKIFKNVIQSWETTA